jgi:hypothetical protein
MPADKRRKMVVARMFPDQKAKLDALCVYYTNASGKLTSGSEIINLLVEQAYAERIKKDGAFSVRVATSNGRKPKRVKRDTRAER